ncbi:Por secretion system C-terminal sorting domain-containing protein [Chryseobacterium arachidis]|uniref:Por secretion system C-terminal sorting domain-containing protein n=1 Tax=Chryseobacterium arachidis TaxID=1416778 RepID=A0A1M5BE36_9FLAO|nr:GEVED domain-containing protein [Chryseobacterium arachidis]SHF40779.1 Por secretion system C-terminal sorting domain-containing protein [Chryseobacterium arachidis]
MRKKLLQTVLIALPFFGFGQVIISEDFNGTAIPSTWTVQQLNANETWGIYTNTSGSVASVDYDESLGQQNEWLISPSFALGNANYYYLKFKAGLSYYWAVDPNDNYDVFAKISTDNGATWTQIWSETNLGTFSNYVMNSVMIDLNSYKNNPNVKIAFQYVGSDGAAFYIDDFSVEASTTVQLNYCGPLAFVDSFFGADGDEPITLVNFAGINNTSDSDLNVGNSHEFFLSQSANVTPGQSYDITLKGNTGGNYENSFAVFIDWNQNGILNDPGEVYPVTQTITASTGEDAIQAVHSIAVPATALTGSTRMRVKKIYGTLDDNPDLIDPCAGSDYGQAEDYNVTVALSPLAVNETDKKDASFKVYPNPTSDILNFDSKTKVKSVYVVDLSGRNVISSEVNQNKFNIDLSKLPAGTYIVTAQTESGLQSTKVIKK